MSLINKMLLDLDARADKPDATLNSKPILEGLRPVTVGMSTLSPQSWLAGVLLLGLMAAGGVYTWSRISNHDIATTAAPDTANSMAVTMTNDDEQTPAPASVHESVNPELTSPDDEGATGVTVEPGNATTASVRDGTGPALAESASVAAAELHPLENREPNVENIQLAATNYAPESASSFDKSPRTTAFGTPERGQDRTGAKEMSMLDTIQKQSQRLEKIPRPLTPHEDAENLYRDAMAALQTRQADKAEEQLRQALAQYPQHIAAREALAELYLQQGHWSDVQQVLYRGVTIAPEHHRFVFLLARVYVEQGNDVQALALLESNRSHAATDADYIGLLATLYQRAGRHDKAEETFMQALSLRPDEGRWWLGLGISCEAQRKWPEARDAYVRVRGGGQLSGQLVDYADKRLAVVMRHLG